MRKSVMAVLVVILMVFGVGYYFLNKQDQTITATRQAIAVVGSTPPSNTSPPKNQSGGNPKGTTVNPVQSGEGTNSTNANDPGPGTIIFPSNSSSSGSKGKANEKASPGGSSKSNSSSPTSNIPSVNSVNTSDSGSSNPGNSSSDSVSSSPVQQSVPQSSSPTAQPVAVVASTNITPSESLSSTASGQPMLGAPSDLRTYPIIPNGMAYQGTMEPSSNLTQADITRLASYPTVSATDVGLPASMQSQLITYQAGSYATNASFKHSIDEVIKALGPHLDRKLQTSEWQFTPSTADSYGVFSGGDYRLRGILKVRYSGSNNPLNISANVWYQGDVDIGMSFEGFLTNNAQDRVVRPILMNLIILGNWGPIS